MTRGPVIVIGAGIGGLAAALDLAGQEADVLVLERAAWPGGKMRELSIGGRTMDAGPTVFTMRWVFDELFERAGSRLADHLNLQPIDILARHAWNETEQLDLYADIDRSADAIGAFAGAAERRGYLAFSERAARIYRTLEKPFLRSARPTPLSLAGRAGLRGLPDLLRISPFTTLWQEIGQHFRDPRLQQLFGRYATYCGSSPFLAPATLMLVAHVEQAGVWQIEGGMHRVAVALADCATARGARFRYHAEVAEILLRDGRAAGVRLAGGECIEASAVIFNGDSAALAEGRLGAAVMGSVPALPRAKRSLSALTWNLLARPSGLPLLHHTVCFSPDYAAEFSDIGQGRLPASPTVYVCAQDRRDGESPRLAGEERLLLIVNAPARGDGSHPFTESELARCETQTFETLSRCGLQLERQARHSRRTTPSDFDQLFPATGGALYGPASHGWMASFSRPGSRSKLPGLYLAGGSTHPGPGVPMAALSGSLAAKSLVEDRPARRASMWSSGPVATPGGTSTR